jgi:hypothetical protein
VAMLTYVANGQRFTHHGGGKDEPAFVMVASIAHGLLGNGAYARRSRSVWLSTSR